MKYYIKKETSSVFTGLLGEPRFRPRRSEQRFAINYSEIKDEHEEGEGGERERSEKVS